MQSDHLLRDADYQEFKDKCKELQLDHVEEIDLHIAQSWAVGDRASAAGGNYSKNVLSGTSDSLVERTQDPPLGIGNKLPGDSLLMIFAVQCAIRVLNVTSIANLLTNMPDMDRSVLRAELGGARIFELYGPQFMDFGPGLIVGNDTTAPNTGRAPTSARNIRRLNAPRIIGTEQTLVITHNVSRGSDWSAAFTADYTFAALLGRKR